MRKNLENKRKKGRKEKQRRKRKTLLKLRLLKRETILICTFGSRQSWRSFRFYTIRGALKIAQMPLLLPDLNATASMIFSS
jgi:hypothetical protein